MCYSKVANANSPKATHAKFEFPTATFANAKVSKANFAKTTHAKSKFAKAISSDAKLPNSTTSCKSLCRGLVGLIVFASCRISVVAQERCHCVDGFL